MALLKILLLLGLGVSVNSDVSLQKRIIGGHNCADTERLFHVRLEGFNGTNKYFCGGSLIHSGWVLTTDACWKSEPGWIKIAKLRVHPLTARQKIISLPNVPVAYTPEGWQHDIMLLRLQRKVKDVPLAQLPDCSYHLRKDDVVQLAGEGAMTTGPNNERLPSDAPATHLQCVDMKVVEVSHFLVTYGHVFSAAALNKDACYGDYGSAAMFNGKIYGVISPGVPDYACHRPAYIIDVCKYMEWITSTIHNE
ncbi:kallikrein 1-related peptidase b21-like [Poeciliopsis prolifica]|uniref:kallikrein 1-related peptidase b21-like n=1 Tax=Poeciliopsis prolifica TaxID=188132 RepID=UPI0024131F1F|nr:kallikrein 1-related peptidase b21-like [Poeciliopsis prolifica]